MLAKSVLAVDLGAESGRVIQVSAQNYQRSEALVLEWDDEVFLSWDSSCNVVLSE